MYIQSSEFRDKVLRKFTDVDFNKVYSVFCSTRFIRFQIEELLCDLKQEHGDKNITPGRTKKRKYVEAKMTRKGIKWGNIHRH